MSAQIDALATQMVTLDPEDQGVLWEKVAELNCQRGLETLAQAYRAR